MNLEYLVNSAVTAELEDLKKAFQQAKANPKNKNLTIQQMRAAHPTGYKLEKNKEDTKTVFYLYGDIVDEWPTNPYTGLAEEGDFITPADVRNTLGKVSTKDLEIHINSYGGSVFASIAIKNYLAGLGKDITVIVDDVAASGASIIAMAGNTIKMPETSLMLIHRAITFVAQANSVELRKIIEKLRKIDIAVASNYLSRYTRSKKELEDQLDAGTWISADEAKALGLCDEVTKANTLQNNMLETFVNTMCNNLK